MRLNLFILLVFLGVASFASKAPEVSEVRDSFFYGWAGECGASDLYLRLEKYELTDPILIAYKGAAEMTQANCISSPWKKYQFFKNGKRELESAIVLKPENFEIRYLRFAVQCNLPAILNYNNIEEDKQFLIESLTLQMQNTIPDEYMNSVLMQMIQSDELSQEEKSKLNLLLSKK
jgi:hypothetical protein